MPPTKRQHNDQIPISNNNKKRKLEDQIAEINSAKYLLEDLANEILYELFEYLDSYDIYKGFYNLNRRFQNLAINSNVLTKINVSTMSKINFKDYYQNILIPNRNQIKVLRLSNPFTADVIFSPPRTILNFVHLEKLILDKVQIKYFTKVFRHLQELPKLHSLTISLTAGCNQQSLDGIFSNIFHLPKLKYCKIEYEIKRLEDEPVQLYFTHRDSSLIECLIINGRFPFNQFQNLLWRLPKLQYLSINCLVESYDNMEQEKLTHTELKYLKYVSLKFDFINFHKFEEVMKKCFYHVQMLRLTTDYNEKCLSAKRWQQLIMSYMPYLRIFDINHQDYIEKKNFTYHHIINQFNSSFWTGKNGFLHINMTRRNNQLAEFFIQPLHIVEHLHIASEEIVGDCLNYFPNVNELSIENKFTTSGDSIIATLRRMISLRQLTKLVIQSHLFPIKDIINLLLLTPNVHTLSLNLYILDYFNINSNRQKKICQYVSKKNKIQNLILNQRCSLTEIQFIVYLLPRLKCLKAQMERKEIGQIIRFLLSKTHNRTRNLFYLCILEVPKVCLTETKVLIESKNLLNDYSIKYIDRDLHLWW
ncbi:unnamed protein product [Rotaria magnacalcarata]|uniref:F-box domain-containing protein n=1 Tax=Rotaria magnacalcarata TaxID=392030 RepID=A0A816FXL1_9BILA|nr:unnamed protein product [Rotaria magnacalcarata]CAF1925461.1 unnamed protein product [Rotaria magnacalcarata]CAF3996450.1 unnamed protein product [Rotaria magnacalcarata]CAF4005566.1 unnamed protein product [Rotaria magnacalcarata]